jgi:formyl-CoA transferase
MEPTGNQEKAMTQQTETLLLDGLRVIDAASFLAGPGAATVLADYGADVIKVEPFAGDGYRTLSRPWRTDYNWQLTSRNKRSLALNLGRAQGRAVMHRLLADADVLVLNFFDDQIERYGLTCEAVLEINPRIIYARLTAYGSIGPEARKRGFDSTGWWARTGLMDMVRETGGPPVMGAPGFGDHSTAMSLFGAIMLGLYRRERTGEGGAVETSLLASGLWANGMQIQGAIAGFDLGALRQEKGLLNPLTSVYETADGRFLLFAIINAAREWPGLCRALDREDWIAEYPDVRSLMKARAAIRDEIARIVAGWTLEQACRTLDEADVTYSVVQNLDEVMADAQARAAGFIVETGSEDPDYQLTVANPIQVLGEGKRSSGPAPEIGEHSHAVLSDAGFSDAEIEALVAGGAVATPDSGENKG